MFPASRTNISYYALHSINILVSTVSYIHDEKVNGCLNFYLPAYNYNTKIQLQYSNIELREMERVR